VQIIAPPVAEAELLIQAQLYLANREKGLPRSHDLDAAWIAFYDFYSRRIRNYAFTCKAAEEDIADCVQEVWTELLVRLQTFRLDPKRGKFDTWLFHIVRGKTVDQLRSRKRRLIQGNSNTLPTVIDCHPGPARALEEKEIASLAWDRLRKSLSECNFRVLQMRLVEQRPVAEVADKLGLSREQVWYRYHRARREIEEAGSTWSRAQCSLRPHGNSTYAKKKSNQEFAQGKTAPSVSRFVSPSSRGREGVNCVDYVFQKLELGRRDLNPEWKVEWNCDALPRPALYIRKMAIVAYAEMCGPGEFMNTHWPRIVHAAIAAGVAAGIATIIATPTAALPVFETEFHKQLHGKGASAADEDIRVALSAKQEANGPWCLCKD
jgi:RNA polymerase sigma factor (sigma-70 family)